MGVRWEVLACQETGCSWAVIAVRFCDQTGLKVAKALVLFEPIDDGPEAGKAAFCDDFDPVVQGLAGLPLQVVGHRGSFPIVTLCHCILLLIQR